MTQGQDFFPARSIMTRLKERDPDAGPWILQEIERLKAQRRIASETPTQAGAFRLSNLLKGAFWRAAFRPEKPPGDCLPAGHYTGSIKKIATDVATDVATNVTRRVLQETGNNLRQAISAYMTLRDINPETFFSDRERQSMTRLTSVRPIYPSRRL